MVNKLIVSNAPHIKSEESTMTIMLDVIIALVPAGIWAVVVFGLRALVLICVSVASCVLFEFLFRKITKKSNTVLDLSAVVTGILLAYNVPAAAPYWLVVIGAFFAIVIVKQLFGGIGRNFMNPALAARAFLFSWPTLMSTFTNQFDKLPVFGKVDTVATATPLVSLKNNILPTESVSVQDLFFGAQGGGCIGEVSAALLILGGIYLLFRGTISWHIPVSYIGTVALVTLIFPRGTNALLSMQYELVTGGLMLGAIFMATDYATSPITKKGKIIYGIGCGLLTVFIRYFGGYPEGVSYSILIMNVVALLIDKKCRTVPFGIKKSNPFSKFFNKKEKKEADR